MIKINNVPCVNIKDIDNEMEFILLHKLIDNEVYRNHYLNSGDTDKYFILDNSAFELKEGISDSLLMEWAVKVVANEIIIPDVYGDKEKTLKLMNDFFEKHPSAPDIYTIQAVPQGKNEKELIECFEIMERDDRISVIGVNKLWNRKKLKDSIEGCTKKIHLLGLNNIDEWNYDYGELDIRSGDSRRLSQLILGKEDIWEDILTSIDLEILKRLIKEINNDK